jgi:hypothetical protein
MRHIVGRHAPYSPEGVERLYGKCSNAGESPRHEADHGSVHERLSACTKLLVVFAHPPLLVDPSDRPLHHPPPRQHQVALGGNSFCQSTATPTLAHSLAHAMSTLFWGGLFWALEEIDAPPEGLFYPVSALVLSALARLQPQVREAGE